MIQLVFCCVLSSWSLHVNLVTGFYDSLGSLINFIYRNQISRSSLSLQVADLLSLVIFVLCSNADSSQ